MSPSSPCGEKSKYDPKGSTRDDGHSSGEASEDEFDRMSQVPTGNDENLAL